MKYFVKEKQQIDVEMELFLLNCNVFENGQLIFFHHIVTYTTPESYIFPLTRQQIYNPATLHK